MEIKIRILPKRVLRILILTILILLIGQILFLVTQFFYGYSFRHFFLIFNFDNEGFVPTLYSTFAILFAALLLLVVSIIKYAQKEKDKVYWFLLFVIFCLLAYDEAAEVHEGFNEYFWDSPYLPTWLGFGWVIPYSILVLIIGVFFIKFLKSLPKKISLLFLISGLIFISGAIGMELPGAYLWFNTGGFNSLYYNLAATVEELLEMLGIAVFIYAILKYLEIYCGPNVIIVFRTPDKELN
ncbi:hypothetical protein BH23BAC1_BH23BAC1_19380 [soil metagenome]